MYLKPPNQLSEGWVKYKNYLLKSIKMENNE